jgi:hypothetical protein
VLVYPFGHSALEFARRYFSAIAASIFIDSIGGIVPGTGIMKRSVKTIAMLASAAVLVCSIFVVGWVGLALLGY